MQTPVEGTLDILKNMIGVEEVEVEKRMVEIELPKCMFDILKKRALKIQAKGWVKENSNESFSFEEILNHTIAASLIQDLINDGEILALIVKIRTNNLKKV